MKIGSVSLLHPLARVGEDGRMRCPECGASSFDPSILEEIRCSTEQGDPDEPGQASYHSMSEPPFPQIGDLWADGETVWVRILDNSGDAWLDCRSGDVKTGQQSLPGVGHNPSVRKYHIAVPVPALDVDIDDSSDPLARFLRKELISSFTRKLTDDEMIRVSPLEIECLKAMGPPTVIATSWARPLPKGV
jgi:hypothetical protein